MTTNLKEETDFKNIGPKKVDDKYIAIGLGFFFVILIIIISLFIPCPSSSQYNIFRIVISISIAGIATIIPGSFEIKINPKLTATGALAIFMFVYHYDPAQLNTPNNCPDDFDLTVYVHINGDKNDRILKNKGKVILDLGSDSREASIGARGEAHFMEIPLKFWNKSIKIGLLDGVIYKPTKPDSTYILNGEPVYLAIQAYGLETVTGTVKDEDGKLLEGAIVRIKNVQTSTNNVGYFNLKIPNSQQSREQQVTISLNGYKVWEGIATPETDEELKAILLK
jgi:hypothetical protein